MKNKALNTKAKNALKSAGILWYDEKCHIILDVSRLKSVTDEELRKIRNVGSTTINFINNLKKLFDWIF